MSESENIPSMDDIIPRVISKAITVEYMSASDTALVELATLAKRIVPALFFTDAAQSYFETTVFADKQLLQLLYSVVVRLKFQLGIEGLEYESLIDTVSDCGSYRQQPISQKDDAVSEAQSIFNEAYITSKEYRRRVIQEYEWSLALFLMNIYLDEVMSTVQLMQERIVEEAQT